jgi:chitosanase
MDLSALQKAAAQAIVNIFETGSIRGNYGDVTLLRGDSGQLTYGRSQTTLASGNLFLLINDYAQRNDGAYSEAMKPYLAALEANDSALNTNSKFRQLLKDAGDDPVMQEVQDAFFDRVYWDPAMRSADALGATSALGAAIVYDSTVHGSWAHIRDMTRKEYGELSRIGEEAWMGYYVDERRNWLATHPNSLLHKTVYRMDSFKGIIAAKNWRLALPIPVRGLSITEAALSNVAATPVKVPAESGPHRLLRLKSPPLSGPDVSWVQERLARAGIHVKETGEFDQATDQGVRAFQEMNNLKADGVVGPVTRSALEDLTVTTPAKSAELNLPMPAVAPLPSTIPELVENPVTVIADDGETPSHPPAHTAPTHTTPAHTAPAHTSHPAPATHDAAPDAVTDIKQHITDEVQRSIDSITGSIHDQNVQILQKIASGDTKGAIEDILKDPSVTTTIVSHGRPIIAAILSLITLAFTESRDFLSWTKATGNAVPAAQAAVPPVGHPVSQISNFDQAMAALRDYGSQAWVMLHNLAGTVPNEWVFRLRVAALALIAYAVTRLFAHHRAQVKAKPG